MRLAALLSVALTGAAAADDTPGASVVERCLSCHLVASGSIDIVGLRALEGLPEEWPFLFEDQFDLDADGVAGAMRFVSGAEGPIMGIYGSALAAGRFEDFARIAGAAHGIAIPDAETMDAVRDGFFARSPDPGPVFADEAARQRFEARGCADCHVTRSYEFSGRTYRPLSDFLLHDLGEGPTRTAPLWGCPDCVLGDPHRVDHAAR